MGTCRSKCMATDHKDELHWIVVEAQPWRKTHGKGLGIIHRPPDRNNKDKSGSRSAIYVPSST